MLQSVTRISRRRALTQGLAMMAGMAVVGLRSGPVYGQVTGGETPGRPSAPVGPPEPPMTAAGDPTANTEQDPAADVSDDSVSVGQATDDSQPADQPPLPAGPGGVPPVKLMIPSLGVEAAVEAVGQDPDGAMSTPTHPDDVAWYRLGPGMGVPGNVVVAAHVNWDGRLRVFGQLHLLEPGDVVQIIDEQGRGFEYAVESSEWVRAEGAPLDEIFAQPSEPVLTLITCGGEYVAASREYLDRLIVRARGA